VRWSDDLPGIQVWGVHLPGRTTRQSEPAYTEMGALVSALVSAVEFDADKPFAFFGQSFGALVAFEVAKELRMRGRALPGRLILSSCPAPPLPTAQRPVSSQSDDDLLDALERAAGEVLSQLRDDQGLREHALGCFRADYALLERYDPGPSDPLDCSITVFAGSEEPWSSWRDGWAAHSRLPASLRVLAGGHFYFRERRGESLHALRESVLTPGGGPEWTE
jgi:surfactin synthase thioesterase subunit